MESRKKLSSASSVNAKPVETMVDVFRADVRNKKIILEKPIQPTDNLEGITEANQYWLYASNNKYARSEIDPDKIGKWMLFYPADQINAIWEKVKIGVREGDLWNAKVSVFKIRGKTHAIMIYTKDYSDMPDVIGVLAYLEKTGLKPKKNKIRYKTDAQTRAGIYAGGRERPWIYCSSTVRQNLHPLKYKQEDSIDHYHRSDVLQWRSKQGTIEKKREEKDVPIDRSSSTSKISRSLLSSEPSFDKSYRKYGSTSQEKWSGKPILERPLAGTEKSEAYPTGPLSWRKKKHRDDAPHEYSTGQSYSPKSPIFR